MFRKVYDRGDLPVTLIKVNKVGWRSEPKNLGIKLFSYINFFNS